MLDPSNPPWCLTIPSSHLPPTLSAGCQRDWWRQGSRSDQARQQAHPRL
jgi:hypothetical protein